MALTESDTRAQYIDPALAKSGWGGHLVRREFQITAGRIIGAGKRAEPSIADYLLEYRGKRLAVIEAKKWDLPHSEGVSQAVRDSFCFRNQWTEDSSNQFSYRQRRRH